MRKKSVAALFLTLSLMLCACSGAIRPPYIAAPPQTLPMPTQQPATMPAATQLPKPIWVSPLAMEDFLEPVEEFSWERKAKPEFVMLHFTSAVVPHPEDPFSMDYIRQIFVDYDLSVHYIIQRDGTVRCYIPENRVAWHAGAGQWGGNPQYTNNMNQYAIGIELVAIGSPADMAMYLTEDEYLALDEAMKGFTDAQYAALRALVADICRRHEIPMDKNHVIGHDAYNPEKTDPGSLFDWGRVLP